MALSYFFRALSQIPHSINCVLDTMSNLNLQEIHDFAVDVAKKAGEMILKASNSRLASNLYSITEKKNCPSLPGREELIISRRSSH